MVTVVNFMSHILYHTQKRQVKHTSSRSLQTSMAKRNGGWGLLRPVRIKNDYLLRVMEELYLRGVPGLDDLPLLRFSGFMSASNLGWQ